MGSPVDSRSKLNPEWTLNVSLTGLLQVTLGAYRGAGNTTTALGFSLVELWLGRVPIVYGLTVAGDVSAHRRVEIAVRVRGE